MNMSSYLVHLHLNEEKEKQWTSMKDAIVRDHHGFRNFTTVHVPDREYQIVLDGELYNEKELKAALRAKGVKAEWISSEEMLVYAYRIWGHALMKQLLGAYALAIYDGNELFVAKDQMGLKPIFYAKTKDSVLVAPDIKTLLESGEVKAIVDREGLSELLALGPSISENKTLYRDIKAMAMGHYMVIRDGDIRIKQYYNPVSKPHFETFADTKAHVRYLVEDAIKRQSVDCDATFLSGGLDSSIIASVLAKQKHPLYTYSLDYEGNAENFKGNMYQVSLDHDFIEAMIAQCGCEHTKLTITQQELAEELIPALTARDLPGMGDVDSALLWLCKQVKKDRSVIMSGECSDEVFGGYPWFYREELAHLDTFPWLRSTKEREAMLHEQLRSLDLEAHIAKCYEEALHDVTDLDTDSEADRRARIHTILCLHWFMQTLVTRQVCMGNAAEVNIRAPFADVRIIDYVYNIPWDMKFANGEEKGILRAAFEDDLPEAVAHRKKNPFPKTHNPQYTQIMIEKMQKVYAKKDSILHVLFDDRSLRDLIESGGAAFTLPWYGQLMSGPQLLAYLYQIDAWFENNQVELQL